MGQEANRQILNVLFRVRLPRIIAAMLIGPSLALSGAVYQSLFQNPLVSQDILGVSSGATVGAAIGIIIGLSKIQIMLFAFGFGLLAVITTILLSNLFKSRSVIALVLSGIVVSGFFNSLIGYLKYIADTDSQLAPITFWQMGSLAKISNAEIYIVCVPILLSMAGIFILRWRLTVLQCDALSVETSKGNKAAKYLLIIFATVLTSSAVCVAGTISWLGLVLPHIARALVGSDNKKVIPVSTVVGGIFLVAIDAISRNLSGQEIPLSILSGSIGAPIYIIIIYKNRRRYLL